MDRVQQIILGIAGVVVLFQCFHGWRMGPIRQIVRFGALAAAYAAGAFGAPAVVPLLRPLHFPDFLLQYLAAILLGFLAYFLVNLFGRLLFKKTSDQGFGLVWFFYGVTGSLIGMAFGIVLVVVVAVAIRLMGAMVEGAGPMAPAQPSIFQRVMAPVISTLPVVKHSLETGATGEFLKALDPVPKGCYQMIGKVGQVASRPAAVNRFAEYPGAKELVENPEIAALREDPEIAREVAAHNYLALLKNERMVKTCNDPKLAKMLKQFDVNKALDFALKQ